MVDKFRLHSPLAHLALKSRAAEAPEDVGVVFSEIPFRGMINVRGDASDKKFIDAVKKATRLDLPVAPNTVAGKPAASRLMWLGPDEWLVITRPGGGDRAYKAAQKAVTDADIHAAVTDVSDSRTCIRVSGQKARTVLAKGCSLDLHPSVFGPGQCAQTIVAKVGVMMTQTAAARDGSATYELYPLRSFSTFLWTWLEDAAAEFGFSVDTD